jgi:hypothetical protein
MTILKGRLPGTICALVALLALTRVALGQSEIRINEVLANNLTIVRGDGSVSDWVELINPSGADVSLAGASLTDNTAVVDKWKFPAGVIIPANGFLVVAFDKERAPSSVAETYLNTGFSLSAKGAGVYLYAPNLGPLIDSVKFGVQVGDLSVGKVNGVWTLCNPTAGRANAATLLGSPLGLRVNEWLANTSGDDWFEIFNTGSLPVSLEGLFLTDSHTSITKSPVPALSFIGTGNQAFVKFIADNKPNNGPDHVAFGLNNDGEEIGIYDSLGTQIDLRTFTAQAAEISEGLLPDGVGVKTRFPDTASPGEPNYKELTSVIVSEVLSHTDPPLEDAVEFYNTTDAAIDISGWFLSNKKSDLKRYQIPPNTIIGARGYKVIYERDFNATNSIYARSPFTFNSAHGDQVYLAQVDSNGALTGLRAGEDFEAAENGVSFGRVDTSVAGVHQFVAMSRRTFGVDNPQTLEEFRTGQGAPNSGPKVGPVFINEIMFNPPLLNAVDNTRDEFIELYNLSSSAVLLYDPAHPTNTWRLQNGVSFVFPQFQFIPAFGYALVVAFDPANTTLLQQFRANYGLPDSVAVYGPYRDAMKNSGTSLELYKPDPPQIPPHPDAGFIPYIRVDKVNFSDAAPWPTGADRSGYSLQRKSSAAFGNDYINWEARFPTPAAGNSPDIRDTDGDGAPDVWETQFQFDPNSAADGALDFDGDGLSNVQEYIAGTNPKDPVSVLKIFGVFPAQGPTSPLTLNFTAEPNKSYSVQYRNSLSDNSTWQILQNVSADPAGRVMAIPDLNAWGRTDRYYRIITPALN